jgi:predicted nucleic acid-binding protein
MTYYFLDSSALIKRYLPEKGTRWIRSTIATGTGNRVVIAQITPAEVISGISRRKREGHISARHAEAVRQLLERHVKAGYVGIRLTEGVVSQACDLLEKHPLRAYDAVQLASAIESNNRLVSAGLAALVFVSADKQLLSVADNEGFAVEDPNNYP